MSDTVLRLSDPAQEFGFFLSADKTRFTNIFESQGKQIVYISDKRQNPPFKEAVPIEYCLKRIIADKNLPDLEVNIISSLLISTVCLSQR